MLSENCAQMRESAVERVEAGLCPALDGAEPRPYTFLGEARYLAVS